jgi:hypothetical protein
MVNIEVRQLFDTPYGKAQRFGFWHNLDEKDFDCKYIEIRLWFSFAIFIK